jgi:hypothetical protein
MQAVEMLIGYHLLRHGDRCNVSAGRLYRFFPFACTYIGFFCVCVELVASSSIDRKKDYISASWP